MSARTRKHQVQRLMWGDSRRCRIGRHAYVTEQNAWIEGETVQCETRWKCWACGHWQTSPPIGTIAHRCRIAMRQFQRERPEEYAAAVAQMERSNP